MAARGLLRRLVVPIAALVLACSGSGQLQVERKARSAGAANTSADVPRAASFSCPAAAQPGPQAPSLVYLGAASGAYSDPFAAAALLTDGNGTPIAGAMLSFGLGAQSTSAATDARGVARVTLFPDTTGQVPLAVAFAGDASFQPAQLSLTASIARDETAIRYTGAGFVAGGGPASVAALLTDPEDGLPIAGRSVAFQAGSATATAVTDATGVATAALDLTSVPVGPAALTVSFAGDSGYEPSSATAPVVLYAPSQFVVWGGNQGGLQLGDRVQLWGAQWASQVSAGDFAANPSFKGYADTVPAFALCEAGAHTSGSPLLDQACWTTKPGNSFPPAQVPAYASVIVSTAIAKDGSTEYGNIAGIAIVRVDAANYLPDPGHPMFGTIVGALIPGGVLPPAPTLVATQTQPQAALPGQSFAVVLEVAAGSASAAFDATAAENFTGSSPATASSFIGTVTPGQHVTTPFAQFAPRVTARGGDESSAAYATRLAASDGLPLSSTALVSFDDTLAQPQIPATARSFGLLSLPRLSLALTGVPCVAPGETVSYTVTAANLGSADAASSSATVTFPDGTSATVALGTIASGATASASVQWTVPAIAPIASGESNAGYLARLASFDGKMLPAAASATWTDAAANAYGAVEASFASVERVPLLQVAPPDVSPLLPGQAVALAFGVTDLGSGPAPSAELSLTNPDGSAAGAASFSLAAGESAVETVTATAPVVAPRQAGESDTSYLARLAGADGAPLVFGWSLGWTDTSGDAYGPETGSLVTSEILPVVGLALGAPSTAHSGDTITYTIALANQGHAAAVPSVTLRLPDGSTQSPLAPLLPPGGTASLSVPFTISASFPGGTITANAAVTWLDAGGNAYGPVGASASTQVTHPNLAPVVSAGPDQTLQLPASATLPCTASDDGFPLGSTLTVRWSQVSGPGTVSFANAASAATTASFSAAGTYVLQLTGSDGQLSSSSQATITVQPAVTITARIVLAPAASGPDVTGNTQALTATITDGGGAPIAGATLTFTIAGANPGASGTAVSDASGVAHFQYIGAVAGTDSVVATATVEGQTFTSNTATVAWVTPVQPVSTISVRGRFFASNGSGPFNTPKTATPAFEQFFPTIDFNPPSGTVPGNTSGVNEFTRPMTDVTTDLNGNFTGVIVAKGNGHQAGSGDLFNFQAVFTSAFVVAAPGDVRYDFYSDDGFIFSVAGGATYVSGPRLNLPPGNVSPFEGYPVMGAYNQATAPVRNSITVHFPAAGTYPYELDYSECCAGQLAITMASSTNGGHGVPPTGSLILSPNAVSSKLAGTGQGFTVTAVDASNIAQANVLVTLQVSGANPQTLTALTNATGVAAFTYLGARAGADEVQARATFSNSPSFSNVVDFSWQSNPNQPQVAQPAAASQSTVTGASVQLSALGSDTGGEAGLTYTWSATGPAPVAFDPNGTNAAKNTVATFSAAGTYQVTVTITDPTGYSNLSTLSLPVVATLTALSVAPATATLPVNVANPFAAAAHDQFGNAIASGLAFQWTQQSGPGTASFDAPSAASTNATFDVAGEYLLLASASDGTRTVTATANVTAQVINQPPVVSAGPGTTLVQPANTYTLQGSASDDGLPAGSTLSVTWTRASGPTAVSFASLHDPVTLATFSDVGTYVLRLTASDGALSASSDVTVTVLPPPGAPPTVALTGPADGSTLTSPTAVTGSVSDGFWTLAYVQGGASGAAPIVIASGDGAASGRLGTFDPTLLLNGAYQLVLTATTDQGSASASIGVTVQGKQKVGLFTLAFEDMKVSLGGLPIRFVRKYDSRDKAQGDFGVGWRLALDDVRVEKTQVIGQNWGEIENSIFFFPQFCLVPTRAAQVAITFGDGRSFKFDAGVDLGSGSPCSVLFPALFGSLTFNPEPGTVGSLVALDDASFQVSGGPTGPVTLLSDSTFDVINPRRFQLTTGDGTVYVINQDQGIESVTDRNGNGLTFGPGGIASTSGPGVPFTRDAQGRITSITDPNGATLAYAYDASSNLAASTTRTGDTSTYRYDDFHGLLEVKSPSGASPLRNDYDASGRLLQATDALGGVIRYLYDTATNTTTVIDRNGHATSMTYDANGEVIAQTDALGHSITRTFDANGNRLSETDALGGTTTWAYDAANRITSKTDANGGTTSYTFNQYGQPLTVTDPLGHVTTNAYDARGNLVSTTDGDGKVTSRTHDGSGRLASITGPDGAVTSFAYDAAGNLGQMTDPDGVVHAFTYDANGNRLSQSITRTTPQGPQTLTTQFAWDASGRQVAEIHPDGTSRRTEYDVDGRKSAELDELGRRTGFRYDAAGQLIGKDFPDGTSEQYGYDAGGNRTSVTDRGGHTTTFAYDAANRMVATTNPDGTTVQYAYDAAGRLVSKTDERGATASTAYDAVGNVTQVASARGAMSFTYDLAGNKVSARDPNGNVFHNAFDAGGRVTAITYPDGTTRQFTYSGAATGADRTRQWPPIRIVDQAGVATDYVYDGMGRVVQVTDGLGNHTSLGYDEAGNRISVADANGHTTRYEFDARGREVKRILPSGSSSTRSYDAAGHLLAQTDANGHTTSFTYDAAGRLLSRTPDSALGESPVRFTYTASGRRATMVDGTGTTTWTYDARDRVIGKATPFGSLFYTYDARGNRLTLRSDDPAGVSVDYTRDAVNQLSAVSDRGLTTQYAYDAAGDLTSIQFPNGVSTSLAYDSLRRVSSVTTILGAQVLAGFAYTFAPTGLRSSASEASGRTVSWTHDPLSRLTNESVAGDPAGINGAIAYAWDPAGNRLSRTSSVAPVPSASESYDADDRALGDTCDANGNTLAADGTSYAYDSANRLVSSSTGVSLRYDGLGNLVSRTSAGVTTTFLVDDADQPRPARIVEERIDGHAVRSYLWGQGLVSERDASGVHYVHTDARHDVRLLTDASGAVSGRSDYDAYGLALQASGSAASPFGYRSERQDADLGFTSLRARWLRNGKGRFLTRDALFDGQPLQPLSFHKYLYASGDPVDRIDPSGRQDLIETSEAVALSDVLVESGFMPAIAAATEAGIFGAEVELTAAEALAVVEAEGLGATEGATLLIGDIDAVAAEAQSALRIALNIKNWTLAANQAFMEAAVERQAIFEMVSELTDETMLSDEYGITVFARELKLLADAGYRLIDGFLIPPLP